MVGRSDTLLTPDDYEDAAEYGGEVCGRPATHQSPDSAGLDPRRYICALHLEEERAYRAGHYEEEMAFLKRHPKSETEWHWEWEPIKPEETI